MNAPLSARAVKTIVPYFDKVRRKGDVYTAWKADPKDTQDVSKLIIQVKNELLRFNRNVVVIGYGMQHIKYSDLNDKLKNQSHVWIQFVIT